MRVKVKLGEAEIEYEETGSYGQNGFPVAFRTKGGKTQSERSWKFLEKVCEEVKKLHESIA